ncbi:MAG: helix-turn-helix domain-containing protein [Clostridia bacterium]|nr:helix-turn-helix domain-containing protein [Clostridia bacterium]
MSTVFYERRTENLFAGVICDHPFPTHVHDVVEIVCLLTGSTEMSIAGKKYLLIPGDIAIVFPSIPHSYDFVSEDATGLSLIFLPDTIVEFYHTFRTMLPLHPLLPGDVKAPELDPIIRGFYNLSRRSPASPLLLGYLHLFLSYLFSCLPLQPVKTSPSSTMASQVLHYISEHFTEPLSLESVARALGISRIHLSHIFSQQLNINFRQYINTLRIDHARTLLRNPSYSISQIVYQCGYGNQRTFNRAFRAQCGMTANQYRSENIP